MRKLFLPLFVITLAALIGCQSAPATPQELAPSAESSSVSPPAAAPSMSQPSAQPQVSSSQMATSQIETPSTSGAMSSEASDMAAPTNVDQAPNGTSDVTSMTQPSSEPAKVDTSDMATNSNASTDMASASVAEKTSAPPTLTVLSGNDLDDAAFGFTLPSAQGAEYSLESFRGEKNVVLVFYRAFW